MNRIIKELKTELPGVMELLEKDEVRTLKKYIKKQMKEAYLEAAPLGYDNTEQDFKDWYKQNYKEP